MKKPFILGVNGSPKKHGRVVFMLERVLREARRRGAQVRLVHLADYRIIPHSGKLDPKTYIETTDDDMPMLHELVLAADGIVFATPTHWFNVSSLMKLFLDRLTCLEDYDFLLEGKVAGFITYGPQAGAASAAMLLTMTASHMGMLIPPYGAIFDEGRNSLYDRWVQKEYQVLGKNMVQYVRAWKKLKLNWGYPGGKYQISPIELLPKKRLNK